MGTWIKSPRNGQCCDCKPLVCDPCDCTYFGAIADGFYATIQGYSDSFFAVCPDAFGGGGKPAWAGTLGQNFRGNGPCFWSNIEGNANASTNGGTQRLGSATLSYDLTTGKWFLDIEGVLSAIWFGSSAGGQPQDPNGIVISRLFGCDSHSTITMTRVHP